MECDQFHDFHRRRQNVFAAIGLTALVAIVSAHASLVKNSAFNDGLTDWETFGAVFSTGNQGVLTDTDSERTLLYQVVPTPPGTLTLSFDFRNLLSNELGSGGLHDTFFATLYLTDTPAELDIPNHTGFSSAIDLFDLNSDGLSNVHPDAMIAPSPVGSGFMRFTLSIFDHASNAAPAFDLFDLNFLNNDSVVLVDNVDLLVVPEPNSVLTAVSGAILVFILRKRQRPP